MVSRTWKSNQFEKVTGNSSWAEQKRLGRSPTFGVWLIDQRLKTDRPKNLFLLEHSKDNDSFRCFDFISDEFCGKVDLNYHKRYTKQIFDFFDRNFPGVNISEGMRLSYFVLIETNVTFSFAIPWHFVDLWSGLTFSSQVTWNWVTSAVLLRGKRAIQIGLIYFVWSDLNAS